MAISESMTMWAGKPVVDWDAEMGITDPVGMAYRLRVDYEEDEQGITWADRMAALLQDPRCAELTTLVIGTWEGAWEGTESVVVVESLAGVADRLPNLTALFLGDITFEESEISWIAQSDLSPLFNAFPHLQYFGVRGSTGLHLGTLHLPELKTLVVESGGLPLMLIEAVFAADLPALEHLEIWLGTSGYGAEATVENLGLVFGAEAPKKWPRLRYLGLRDSDIADGIAQAIVSAPLLAQLEVLDLSLGTLGDEGAMALAAARIQTAFAFDDVLAANPVVGRLRKLDIHHHYVSPDVVNSLTELGIEVDASERQKEYGAGERYVAVGE